MNFLNNIEEKTIIVCPYNVKNKLLDYICSLNRLINVRFYSLDEIKHLVYFDYNEDTILYLMDKYHYSCEVAKNYIENMYFVENNSYSSLKLSFLVNLKNELDSNNLLIYNSFFLECNKNIPVLIFGYDYLDNFSKKMLSNFNYSIINKDIYDSVKKIYKFNTLEEEVLFVANKIVDLIRNGVDINKINLINLDSDYNNVILKVFKMFNIPVDISISSNILSTVIGKNAYNYLVNSKSFEDTLKFIESYGLNNPRNASIYKTFLGVFNKYIDSNYSMNSIIELIKNELLNKNIDNNNLNNKVRVGSLNNSIYLEDEYVFFVGFNQGVVPRITKDEEYITDDLKMILGLDSSNDINKLESDACINNINCIKNIYISFKLNHLDKEFYPSNLINDNMLVEEVNEINTDASLSFSKIKLSYMLDDLIKYDIKSDLLSKYYNSFDIRFMDYDNKYKTIDKKGLYNYLNNKLVLSYSTIDTFYKCQFRYYVENILKLNKYDDTFDTLVGSLFHFVLSKVYNENFDLDCEYDFYLKDKELTNKEKFYLNKLKKELKIVCDYLKIFQNDTGLVKIFTEKNIKIMKSKDLEVEFKGIVDKIMYKEYDGKTLVSIIDYKTGNADIDIYNSVYGIGMQLIIYLYLITKSNLFTNYSCVGFYLQKILNNEINIEKDKTYLDIKYDNLKLYGYSCDNEINLSRFDPTYENSKYIKSMKITKNGFGSYSKVLSENEMSSLVSFVDKKIDKARDLILNADFSINPKWISDDKEITGCKFCKYKDICNMKNDDIINLKKYKDLSFLKESDNNA